MPRESNKKELMDKREELGFPRDRMTKKEIDGVIKLALGIDYLEVSGEGWACLFSIFATFGKRISEIVELRTNSLETRSVRGKEMLFVSFRIRKKRGEEPTTRIKPASLRDPYVQRYILPYWREMEAKGETYLFPRPQTKTGHIYEKYVWDVIQKMDLPQPVWSHLFRASLATELALEVGSAYELKSWFDWERISTADAYLSREGANLIPLAERRVRE
jgi:integrase